VKCGCRAGEGGCINEITALRSQSREVEFLTGQRMSSAGRKRALHHITSTRALPTHNDAVKQYAARHLHSFIDNATQPDGESGGSYRAGLSAWR
jgi:hypothetical protein